MICLVAHAPLGEYFEKKAAKFKSPELRATLYGLAFLHQAVEGNTQASLDALGNHVAAKSLVGKKFLRSSVSPDEYYGRFLTPALDFKRKFGVLPKIHLLRAYRAAISNRQHLRDLAHLLFNHEMVRGPAEHFFSNRQEHRRFVRNLARRKSMELSEAESAIVGYTDRIRRACEIPIDFCFAELVHHLSKQKSPGASRKRPGAVSAVGQVLEDFLKKRRVKEMPAVDLAYLLRDLEFQYAAYHYFKAQK